MGCGSSKPVVQEDLPVHVAAPPAPPAVSVESALAFLRPAKDAVEVAPPPVPAEPAPGIAPAAPAAAEPEVEPPPAPASTTPALPPKPPTLTPPPVKHPAVDRTMARTESMPVGGASDPPTTPAYANAFNRSRSTLPMEDAPAAVFSSEGASAGGAGGAAQHQNGTVEPHTQAPPGDDAPAPAPAAPAAPAPAAVAVPAVAAHDSASAAPVAGAPSPGAAPVAVAASPRAAPAASPSSAGASPKGAGGGAPQPRTSQSAAPRASFTAAASSPRTAGAGAGGSAAAGGGGGGGVAALSALSPRLSASAAAAAPRPAPRRSTPGVSSPTASPRLSSTGRAGAAGGSGGASPLTRAPSTPTPRVSRPGVARPPPEFFVTEEESAALSTKFGDLAPTGRMDGDAWCKVCDDARLDFVPGGAAASLDAPALHKAALRFAVEGEPHAEAAPGKGQHPTIGFAAFKGALSLVADNKGVSHGVVLKAVLAAKPSPAAGSSSPGGRGAPRTPRGTLAAPMVTAQQLFKRK